MIHCLTNNYVTIDPWFGRPPCPIELDMGCGKGRFTLDLAALYPDRLVLGSDVMLGRLRRLARKIDRRGLRNIELLRANSLELVGYQLPDGCIRRLHLLCPDPWPKTRHRGRRLVTTDFLVRVARVLEHGLNEIQVDAKLIDRARLPIDRMLAFTAALKNGLPVGGLIPNIGAA